MFAKEFYPTPVDIIDKMIGDFFDRYRKNKDELYRPDIKKMNILEPSAGKGDIVDYICKKIKASVYNESQGNQEAKDMMKRIDCIEVDNDLRSILKGKGYRVVHDDFLTYYTEKEYDLIVMNPPFSNGAEHLMKAIKMQEKHGGAIICLLNAETIRNPYSNQRKELTQKLEYYNAQIDYFTNSFSHAERKTDVEVACIKIAFPMTSRNESFILDKLHEAKQTDSYEYNYNTQIVGGDFIKSIVDQYKLEIEAGMALIREWYAMQKVVLSSSFTKNKETGEVEQTGSCILDLCVLGSKDEYRRFGRDCYNYDSLTNRFVKAVRRKYWEALFENKEYTGNLTSNLKNYYSAQVDDLVNYEFSLFNIYEVRLDMMNRMVKGIEDTIVKLFEKFSITYYYADTSNNIHYYNGWKTNKSYYVNKKVIMPLNAYDDIWGKMCVNRHSICTELCDMQKCFDFLNGSQNDDVDVDVEDALKFADEYGETKNIQLKYFTVTFYKKGTCHITFTNEEILKKFNIFGSQRKGWLPPTYGKKQYEDMDNEERAVVDDFEGKAQYRVVMNDTSKYIVSTNDLLMLSNM